ncbi:protein-disulfide reductase [Methyloglobulus morosus KoM1]|uniref:Protein-disulfide reductase n=1 Tax=Methyloglobulus morosus KoM1 TaxID=1116472 RepID=V5BX16_9GAMM|nr:thioredoxin family protein [Methyloglobulus morosus]ESS72404.1 protein-disulfide reductase [Methyloglobulus morosus KoM1]
MLGGLVVIAFAAGLYESTKYTKQVTQLIGRSIAGLALGLALFGGYYGVDSIPNTQSVNVESVKHFEPYSEVRLHELLSQGKPVFLNLTAAWCISCLVNEKVALSQDSVIDAFKRSGITYLKGDWTNRNNEISKILAEFGRSGVPLYVLYPPGSGKSIVPVVLPQILTPEIVMRAVMSGGKADANFKDS